MRVLTAFAQTGQQLQQRTIGTVKLGTGMHDQHTRRRRRTAWRSVVHQGCGAGGLRSVINASPTPSPKLEQMTIWNGPFSSSGFSEKVTSAPN